MSKRKRQEIEEALNTPFDLSTPRQNMIRSIHADLHSDENANKMTREILEKKLITMMRSRKRGLITQQEYRDWVRVIELFYF